MSAFLTTRGMGGNIVASNGIGNAVGGGPSPSVQDKFQIGGPEIYDMFPLTGISTPSDWVLRRKTIP